ncbi:hypothetical protein [Fusobacterium polymorphum]|uniref:hypothetical protein n=1 Tax=Fusobacterium nucleatum subsp. polymorphum TaxID=76857 RepID=UPI00300927C0
MVINYLEMRRVANELIEFIEKYNLNDYNGEIVLRFLKELIYDVIDNKKNILEKEKEISDIMESLFPLRTGLTEMYVEDRDKKKMFQLNEYLENLKRKLIFSMGEVSNNLKRPIQSFYGGMYNEQILTEAKRYYRIADITTQKGFGNYYINEIPKSLIQARIDYAIKLYLINKNSRLIGIAPLNTVYVIEFPAGTVVYEGPISYQGSFHLGGLEKIHIFIENSWQKGRIIDSFPLEKKKEIFII